MEGTESLRAGGGVGAVCGVGGRVLGEDDGKVKTLWSSLTENLLLFFVDGLGVVGSVEVGSGPRLLESEEQPSLEGENEGRFWEAGPGAIAEGGCGDFVDWKICESERELDRESEGDMMGGGCWSCSS